MKKSLLVLSVLALAACTQMGNGGQKNEEKGSPALAPAASQIQKAVCVLYPTAGSKVSGLVTFTQTDSGMVVVADISGLTPGKHGFHIHEYGDCSSPDGKSAGGHLNPDNNKHGGPMDADRHEGDMGNVVANDLGDAHYRLLDKALSFEGKYSIIGRGIIVHADEDDLTTQPTGNAGARVACGTIAIAK